MSAPNATVSSRPIVVRAQLLRVMSGAIELALALVVVGSVAFVGPTDGRGYVPLGIAAGLGFVLLGARALSVRGLRQLLGRRRFSLHSSGRWVTVEPTIGYGPLGWTFDLSAPLFPQGPLLLPGLVFLAGVLASGRGPTFLLGILCVHQLAAAAFAQPPTRARFRAIVAGLGLVLALITLMQLVSGTARFHGFQESLAGAQPFGPFADRSHLAGYMLMVVPMALAPLASAYGQYLQRLGARPGLRQALVALETREGVALLYYGLTSVLCLAALSAASSCGALLAFAASLVVAGLSFHRGRDVSGWAAALVFLVAVLAIPELQARMGCRDAQPDYGQMVTQMGVLGFLIALWAVVRVLRAALSDPCLVAASSGVVLYGLVAFEVWIPAVATLFVVLTAPCTRAEASSLSRA